MRAYELMVVLDPNLDDAAIEALNTRLAGMASQRGGSVTRVDSWGRRRLAYPIGRFRDGIYVLSRLELPPNAADEIKRALRLTESVIRYQLVRAEGLPGSHAGPGAGMGALAASPAESAAPATSRI